MGVDLKGKEQVFNPLWRQVQMITFGRLVDVVQRPQKTRGKRINGSSKNWFLRPDHLLIGFRLSVKEMDLKIQTMCPVYYQLLFHLKVHSREELEK